MQRFYYKQNWLKQLRAFCFAAQERSMSRAGERMGLSQPSVSLLIQALEKELDCELFHRRGRIRLTTQGQALLDLSLPLVEGMDTLPQTFNERCRNLVSGNLNIAAGESTTLYLLPEIVSRFTHIYPQIPVTLHNASGGDGLALLRAGSVDLAVGPMLQVPDDIRFTPLFSYEPLLVTPPGHPLSAKRRVTLRDVEPYGLILPTRKMSMRNVIDIVFEQHGVNCKVRMEAGGWEVIKRYVEMGLGISIVTSICLTGRENLATVPLTEFFPIRSYGLILRRDKFISPAAKKFIELISQDAIGTLDPDSAAARGRTGGMAPAPA